MSQLPLGGAALAELRAALDAWAAAVAYTEPVAEVADDVVAGVAVRRYRPGRAEVGTLVWLHGGGYVAGSLDAIDPVCRRLANTAGATVVSVGYRLAPEHPFPAALDDALAVLAVLAVPGGLAAPVVVGGDSAGGGLAVSAALACGRASGLALLCPWLDLTLGCPSVRRLDGAGPAAPDLAAFAAAYAGRTAVDDPRLSPLLAPDLAALPATAVVTAGLDPLLDEGTAFVQRLRDAGVPAAHRSWPGQDHGFVGQTAGNPAADEALAWVGQWVGRRLAEAAGASA